MTKEEKVELLRKYIDEDCFSYHSGVNDIINTRTRCVIKEDTLNKIANRKHCFVDEGKFMPTQLW